ncbi:hypothetical protein SAMN04488032_101444 [Pacificibacter marinus]|uniref:Uncharacterized protein n=1 Tax=Pacificibacter marinus TaxID=658057 RepID=A0A1Y5RDS3_9RHOB|nr:hypothetical protein SAMN04488032_101444 [Pacificibacter marinus]SLN13899.1 hypothetical protein PAM7971_00203 [Pacificibacter marinus]
MTHSAPHTLQSVQALGARRIYYRQTQYSLLKAQCFFLTQNTATRAIVPMYYSTEETI